MRPASTHPVVGLLALAASACTAQVQAETAHHPTSRAKSQTLTFSPDRVYEITTIEVKPGQMPALMAYFGKVFPIAAADYGVKPLFGLEPVHVYSGDLKPDLMFVNEWPSLDHFKRFTADPRARALFPERDAVVRRLVVTQYQVPEPVTVTLTDGEVIEFAALWIKAGHLPDLQAYMAEAKPIAMRHGLKPMTPLKPAFNYSGDFSPTLAALHHWGTLDRFKAFIQEASPLFPRRDATLNRLEVLHARVRFEGGEG